MAEIGKMYDLFGVTEKEFKDSIIKIRKEWDKAKNTGEIVQANLKGLSKKEVGIAMKFLTIGRFIEENNMRHKMALIKEDFMAADKELKAELAEEEKQLAQLQKQMEALKNEQ